MNRWCLNLQLLYNLANSNTSSSAMTSVTGQKQNVFLHNFVILITGVMTAGVPSCTIQRVPLAEYVMKTRGHLIECITVKGAYLGTTICEKNFLNCKFARICWAKTVFFWRIEGWISVPPRCFNIYYNSITL